MNENGDKERSWVNRVDDEKGVWIHLPMRRMLMKKIEQQETREQNVKSCLEGIEIEIIENERSDEPSPPRTGVKMHFR